MLESIKENVNGLWDSLAEGWRHLSRSATSALTRLKSSDSSGLPARSEVDDEFYLPTNGWAMLGGEVFEDDKRVVVRVELPGMDKKDIDVKVVGDALVIEGEKRFEKESSNGRWRMMERAYGSFHRVVPLAAEVISDEAQASYKNGILRVELPKRVPSRPKGKAIKVV